MSTRVRALLISGGLMVAMLFGALAGPALVDAQTPRWRPPVPWEIPQDIDRVDAGGGIIPVPKGPGLSGDTPADGNTGGDPADKAEEITCSIDGCRVPIRFVDEDGETVKTMVITFEDVEADTTD